MLIVTAQAARSKHAEALVLNAQTAITEPLGRLPHNPAL